MTRIQHLKPSDFPKAVGAAGSHTFPPVKKRERRNNGFEQLFASSFAVLPRRASLVHFSSSDLLVSTLRPFAPGIPRSCGSTPPPRIYVPIQHIDTRSRARNRRYLPKSNTEGNTVRGNSFGGPRANNSGDM